MTRKKTLQLTPELCSPYSNSNSINNSGSSSFESILDLEAFFKKTFIEDSILVRREIWAILDPICDRGWFIDQFNYLAGNLAGKVVVKEVVKSWVDNAYWNTLANFKINKIAGFIRASALKAKTAEKEPLKIKKGKYDYGETW